MQYLNFSLDDPNNKSYKYYAYFFFCGFSLAWIPFIQIVRYQANYLKMKVKNNKAKLFKQFLAVIILSKRVYR